MKNEDLLKLKENFIKELQNIEMRIKESEKSLAELDEQVSDPLDKATLNQSRETTEASRDALKVRLVEVNKALIRLENDEDYGFCEECGEEIGTGRLEARPEAVNCIHCSRVAENKGRLYAA